MTPPPITNAHVAKFPAVMATAEIPATGCVRDNERYYVCSGNKKRKEGWGETQAEQAERTEGVRERWGQS